MVLYSVLMRYCWRAIRAASLWSEDLDELAAAYDGYAGPLKVQVAGTWTLAASIELHRGERAVTDEGAAREIVESLAEQPGGKDRSKRILRKLVPAVNRQRHLRLICLRLKMDFSHPTDHDPCAFHRPADFQASDVIKLGFQLICFSEAVR